MSFKKNISKYISIDQNLINSIFNEMNNQLSKQLEKENYVDNKFVVAKFRELIKKESNQKIPQQKAYEILSSLLGYKNYNIALSKNVDFKNLFIDPDKNISYEKKLNSFSENFLSFPPFKNVSLDHLKAVPTGINELDLDLQYGGLLIGGLTTVFSATNVGKSLFCVSLGANALRLGKKVLHISVEDQKQTTIFRYLSNLSDISYSKISKKEISKEESQKIERIIDQNKDNLKIKKFSEFKITIEDIMDYCDSTYKTFPFDVLIVDNSSSLLTSKNPNSKYRFTMARVARNLSTIARKHNCALINTVQSLKRENNAEILSSNDFVDAGCFEIARMSNIILTLRKNDEFNNSNIEVLLEKQSFGVKNKLYNIIANYPKSNLIND